MNKKNFEDEELLHELFLTTRQTTKIRNAFPNNMSADIKLSKAQISKMIPSGGFLRNMLGNLGKKGNNRSFSLDKDSLDRDNLPGLVSNLDSNAVNKFQRKISGKGAVRARKRFTLFILNEDVTDIIKIIKSLDYSGVLMDGVTETVNHEIKKQEGIFRRALHFNYEPRFNDVFSRNNLRRITEI